MTAATTTRASDTALRALVSTLAEHYTLRAPGPLWTRSRDDGSMLVVGCHARGLSRMAADFTDAVLVLTAGQGMSVGIVAGGRRIEFRAGGAS